jgi:hypothetical protein
VQMVPELGVPAATMQLVYRGWVLRDAVADATLAQVGLGSAAFLSVDAAPVTASWTLRGMCF